MCLEEIYIVSKPFKNAHMYIMGFKANYDTSAFFTVEKSNFSVSYSNFKWIRKWNGCIPRI